MTVAACSGLRVLLVLAVVGTNWMGGLCDVCVVGTCAVGICESSDMLSVCLQKTFLRVLSRK